MFVFGWPSAVLGGILLITGIARRKTKLCVIGAAVSAGFCLYISLNPAPFRWLGLLAVSGNFLSAVAVRKQSYALAAVSIIPFLLVVAFLACAVLNE
jgi:hypothetical protein